jgi:arylsulfatase
VPWKTLTKEQQAFQADKMAVHAAMVDSMDRAIGRVLDQLRRMKAFEDTLVLFLSDNGASAEVMVRGDGHDPKAPLGSAYTYLCLGAGWSTACNTPFRMHKTWVHEGGACTPLVAHWPNGIEARGELRQTPGHAIDVVPTILELAKVKMAKNKNAPPRPGKSLVPAFAEDRSIDRNYLWWSHDGNRAIRVKDWKLVSTNDNVWELFVLG